MIRRTEVGGGAKVKSSRRMRRLWAGRLCVEFLLKNPGNHNAFRKELFIKDVIIFVGDWNWTPPTMGEQWLLKQFSLNHPVEHIQKPKLPKLFVRVETSTRYFIIHNQFVK